MQGQRDKQGVQCSSEREKNSVTPICVKPLMKMLNVINTHRANKSHCMTCMTPTTEVVPSNKVSLSPINSMVTTQHLLDNTQTRIRCHSLHQPSKHV